METVQELIPLAKEMMAQKPNRKLLKLYVLGSVLAFFGVVLGLVETVCSPFTASSRLREEEAAVAELQAARERKALQTQALLEKGKQQEAILRNRQHGS
ncbi:G0/G1 switch protein 2 [Equus asinus]|uniref:G0/G1 switch 2 n=2 Tax=Equus asinus TaxID=9793 RepID=A0A9L0KA16_EQUAS|nr:PREDICTED: G0/G1 switch protein 2 [Equus przewalskii]XP_014690426.1 G0/G1 switch protein 2 [Equus asinus]XP_046539771.1 G0/G1 switch protein 2 [Equus quagga]